MRIVVDTNVLVSGLLNPRGAPGRIVDLITAADASLLVDDRILAEYHEVLQRGRFGFEATDVDALLALIDASAIHVHGALLAGNVRHFPARLAQGIPIISPPAFVASRRG